MLFFEYLSVSGKQKGRDSWQKLLPQRSDQGEREMATVKNFKLLDGFRILIIPLQCRLGIP